MRYIFLLFTMIFSFSVMAGEIKSKISYVQVVVEGGHPNIGVIKFESDPANSPSCASGTRFIIDFSIPASKEMYSLLMAAHFSEREVHLWGTGKCHDTSGLESVAFVRVF